ncbi:MAG: resolvase [Devosia sp.]|uniref:recombinase family protein n=1 Tax=Devosia sp. TaxID=1871048 RepID=UPI00263704C5|nr:recombinase family protein [Devosia sp.]MDB5539811.1 resolvase [Devosia sp.]
MKTIRCAIYTRKSSEEGLDQAFNSLDAQREACAAYILSQASEGWTALPDVYDDGGLSGGTLARPALQRLLGEIAAGRVDTVVVYKVDRLTRSLMDFSKLVETFDKAGTSFVSVTQSFNTTTSMGRLTLNMLLSFAQFEREVTAERIRDKIAASKAKGMWMGGTPPIGYAPDGRTLKVVEGEASLIRGIFDLYLELGNVHRVAERLEQGGVRAPIRTSLKNSRTFGGVLLGRGQIYTILKNPIYVGEIPHKGQTFPGLHDGIVDRDIWDRAQAQLAANLKGHRSGVRNKHPALLSGRIVDGEGRSLVSTHASKGTTRYRYYVSRDLADSTATTGLRIPATEIEAAVRERIGALFDDGFTLASADWLRVAPSDYAILTERCSDVAGRSRAFLRDVLKQVRVHDSRIEIECSTAVIAKALNVEREDDSPETVTLTSEVRLTRSGRAMRLIHSNGGSAASVPSTSLITQLNRARRWWAQIRTGAMDIKTLGRLEGVQDAYITRVMRLVFLSPAVIDAMLKGTLKPGVDIAMLTAPGAISPNWDEQRRAFLPAS